MRRLLLIIVTLALAAACSDAPSIEDVAEGVRDTVDDLTDPAAGGADDGASAGDGSDGGDAPAGGEPTTAPRNLDDTAGLGALCRDYLRADVPGLVVEVQHEPGARPEQAALDHLSAVLRSVVAKPAGVRVVVQEIPGGDQSRSWTAEDLRTTAAAHRRHYSTQQELALYVLSVRGSFVQRESLGVAHRASEFAIFPDRIGPLATLLGGRAALERAVLVHEAGHLLCLVNIGYSSDQGRESAEYPHHSTDKGSVMYWAIENSAVAQLFTGPPPDDFTDADRADLEGLRTGRH